MTRKPRGWIEGTRFYTKDSKYGLKYKCTECGREALGFTHGTDERHHWDKCARLAKKEPQP